MGNDRLKNQGNQENAREFEANGGGQIQESLRSCCDGLYYKNR